MSKHVQIRNLSEETHRALKVRAAEKGLSMSDYVKGLIEQSVRRPDWAAFKAIGADMKPVKLPVSAADMIREDRENR